LHRIRAAAVIAAEKGGQQQLNIWGVSKYDRMPPYPAEVARAKDKKKPSNAPPRATLKLVGGDRLVFGREVSHRDATAFRRLVHKAQEEGQTGFTFDFSASTFMKSVAMAQLVVQAETCRREGMHFDVIEPRDRRLRDLFAYSNWAHHLSPVNYGANDQYPDGWLPVARYKTDEDLLHLVNHTCEVVLRKAQVRRSTLHGLEWAMNEIADNVFQHAAADEGGLLAVTVAPGRQKVQFVVADAGRGIPTTIRTSKHPGLDSDVRAVRHAMKQGVTRDRSIGAGNGLAGAMRIATAARGSFLVHSGQALVLANAVQPTPRGQLFRPNEALDGTLVYFELMTDHEFDLEAALLKDGVRITDWDYLDFAYAVDEQDVRVSIAEEASSTATRIAGNPVRVKVRNLVLAHPEVKVIIDFAGVERVTASFADEVVGKLYESLGPQRFADRVVLAGMGKGLVRGQVVRAMGQRHSEAEKRERRRKTAEQRRRRDRGNKRRSSRSK
jgi:anti-sigma regulatory factor (Ser/Thr protein kinase)/anti-anti-sigma regulatory factor